MHGEQNEMGRLKAALIREYEDNPVSFVTCVLKQHILLSQYFSLLWIINGKPVENAEAFPGIDRGWGAGGRWVIPYNYKLYMYDNVQRQTVYFSSRFWPEIMFNVSIIWTEIRYVCFVLSSQQLVILVFGTN